MRSSSVRFVSVVAILLSLWVCPSAPVWAQGGKTTVKTGAKGNDRIKNLKDEQSQVKNNVKQIDNKLNATFENTAEELLKRCRPLPKIPLRNC